MEFSAEQNVNAPAQFVFERATDIEFFATLARERGLAMTPTEAFTVVRPGVGWNLKGQARGKQIDHDIIMEDFEPGFAFAVSTQHKGIKIFIAVEIEKRAEEKCRLYVDLNATAKGIGAKLALKAAQLTSNKLQQKFRRSVRRAAQWLENEYERSA